VAQEPVASDPEPDPDPSPGDEPEDPRDSLRIEDLVLTERVHDLGRAEMKYPDPEDLLELPGIGYAPANQVWLFLADGSVEELLVRLSQAAELDGVELVMPNLLINTVAGTITTEMCDSTTNASYAGDLARPYQMIGLRDAWTMVTASGLELGTVSVGVVDSVVYGLSPEMNHAGGPRMVGLAPEHLQGSGYEESGSATHGTVVMHVIAAAHRLGGAVGVASIMGGQLSVMASDLWQQSAWAGVAWPTPAPANPDEEGGDC